MRAVRFDGYGDVDVLEVRDVDEPVAEPGRVVVAVAWTSINPGEIAIRNGDLDAMWPSTFPSGQGSDVAGTIHALGDGVRGWGLGDVVAGWSDERAAQADFVGIPADQLIAVPPALPPEQAACLHVAGCSAYGLVSTLAPQAGETVVVTAAAGGVGCATVQLLRRLDVRVLGVAGPDNDDYLRSLGAEPVHRGPGLGHRLREAAPDGIDAVADTFGDGYVELAVGLGVAPDRVATIADLQDAERLRARVVMSADYSSAGVLTELAEFAADGELEFPISEVFTLEQVRDAYRALAERRTRGKILLRLG